MLLVRRGDGLVGAAANRRWIEGRCCGGLQRRLDRQAQVLSDPILDFGNAGTAVEHAAERRMTRMPVKDTADRGGRSGRQARRCGGDNG
jgi:hypothetical protein